MLDATDSKIIELLMENSRSQWKDIGEQVHMTGQAVAARVQRLLDEGIIEGFTLRVNPGLMGKPVPAYVLVSMKSNNHAEFIEFLKHQRAVSEAFRIAGNGCFLLKADAQSQGELELLLEGVLRFGNYSVSTLISRVK